MNSNNENTQVAIITLSCALNYGAVLQTDALYQYVKSLGLETKVIDYITERYWYDNPDYPRWVFRNKKDNLLKRLRMIAWRYRVLPKLLKQRKVFRSFLDERIDFTKVYHYEKDFYDDQIDAEYFITGSDQVWNPQYIWSGIIDLPYYLSFAPEHAQRISYGSSFGVNELSKEQCDETKKYLSKYKAISVREEKGKELLSSMGIESQVVLDPTLLVERERWLSVIKEQSCPILNPYILIFTIGKDEELDKLVLKHYKSRNDKIIKISLAPEGKIRCILNWTINRNYQNIVLPSVYDWLVLFKNASYIYTNSFHGTVFSIIFHKQFSSSVKVANSGRIKNLLNISGLQNRELNSYDSQIISKQIEDKISWADVDSRIDVKRKESQKWLKNIMGVAY